MTPRLPPRDPTVVSELMVREWFDRLLVFKVFMTKIYSRAASSVEHNDGSTSVWMKRASALRGTY
jgi:hypothetical protein